MKKIKSKLLVVSGWLLVNVNVAFAQNRLLPVCDPVGAGGLEKCNLCHLLELVKNIIYWLVNISSVLAAVFIVWGSLVIMTAGGSAEKAASGRKTITTAIIGLTIVLTAWLILGTVIQIVTDSPSKLPWSEIKCAI